MISIIVCTKLVLDPEAPTSAYKVNAETKKINVRGVPPVISPFDENALETALQIKDTQESRITVLSMGNDISKAVMRKTMAVGADQVILLDDIVFKDLDAYATALVLASAIRKIGQYDVILTGMQAADTNAGIVGSGIAESLGIPCVTIGRRVEIDNGIVRVEREIADGYQVIIVPIPVVVTVNSKVGELRTANIKDMMAAQKKTIKTWSAKDLGIKPDQMTRAKICDLFIPQKTTKCEFIEGGDAEELGRKLAIKLRKASLI